MDATTAALIGAGVGAGVGIGSQFLANELALRRDRRTQRRQRLTDALVEAGTSLYNPAEGEQMSDAEFKEWKDSLPADSVAAEDPELHRDLMPFTAAAFEGITTLQIHLGHSHPLIDEYMNAIKVISDSEVSKSVHFRSEDVAWRIKNVPVLGAELLEAQQARDSWMRLAREEIERI